MNGCVIVEGWGLMNSDLWIGLIVGLMVDVMVG